MILSLGPRREGGKTLSCGGIRRGGVRSGGSLSRASRSGTTFVVGIGIAEFVSLVRGSVFRVGIVDVFPYDAVCNGSTLGGSGLRVGFGERTLARSTRRSSGARVSLSSPHGQSREQEGVAHRNVLSDANLSTPNSIRRFCLTMGKLFAHIFPHFRQVGLDIDVGAVF